MQRLYQIRWSSALHDGLDRFRLGRQTQDFDGRDLLRGLVLPRTLSHLVSQAVRHVQDDNLLPTHECQEAAFEGCHTDGCLESDVLLRDTVLGKATLTWDVAHYLHDWIWLSRAKVWDCETLEPTNSRRGTWNSGTASLQLKGQYGKSGSDRPCYLQRYSTSRSFLYMRLVGEQSADEATDELHLSPRL